MNNLLSIQEFNEHISTKELALVEFWAPSCHACGIAEEFLEKLQPFYKTCNMAKFNVENPRETIYIVDKYSINVLPTIILFRDSLELTRIIGFSKKEHVIEKVIRLNI